MLAVELGSIRVDLERARAYVLAHGGAREQARLSGISGMYRPPEPVIRELQGLQNPDGGFPVMGEPGAPSSISSTCTVLHQCKELPPLAGSPMASRAVAFLRRSQQPDGHWEESDAATEGWHRETVPRMPTPAADLTALSVYTIMTFEPDHLDPVMVGQNWLHGVLGQNETSPFCPGSLAAYWAVGVMLDGVRAPHSQSCFDQLVRWKLEAPELAWWLCCTLEAGAGGRYVLPLTQELVRLAAMQQPDGTWPAGQGSTVESTLEALRVFHGFAVFQEG